MRAPPGISCSSQKPLNPRLAQEARRRNEAVIRQRLQKRRQEWSQWEEQAAHEEAQRRQRAAQQQQRPELAVGRRLPERTRLAQAQMPPAAVPLPPQKPPPQPQEMQQSWARDEAEQGWRPRPPAVPPRLRQEQQQAFAAANQQVEREQQAQDQKFAELQANMQRRIAERRKKSGRWMGGSAGAQQQQQQQSAAASPSPAKAATAAPDLGAFMQGGLQRKVARFAEMTNSLRRAQDARGAGTGFSWGRQGEQGSTGIMGSGMAFGADSIQASSWETALNVTRVQRPGAGQKAGGQPSDDGGAGQLGQPGQQPGQWEPQQGWGSARGSLQAWRPQHDVQQPRQGQQSQWVQPQPRPLLEPEQQAEVHAQATGQGTTPRQALPGASSTSGLPHGGAPGADDGALDW